MEEQKPLTRDEVREVDRVAIEELGIPGVVLMENAGRGAADWILAQRDSGALMDGGRVGVLCGRGNNGGDGYVVARHLALGGVELVIGETAPAGELSADARVFRNVCAKMGLPLVRLDEAEALGMGQVDLWVDALIGTGFRPPLRGHVERILRIVGLDRAESQTPVVALDCPSGMDVDTGILEEGALRADFTLTFIAQKVGFCAPGAAAGLGEVFVMPIGAPV